jgi:hypothetical protein
MKILKIKDGKAYYTLEGEDFKIIDIDGDAILKLLDAILESADDIMMDNEEEEEVQNEAEKIIYADLRKKLTDFCGLKPQLLKEVSDLYKEQKEKYHSELAEAGMLDD